VLKHLQRASSYSEGGAAAGGGQHGKSSGARRMRSTRLHENTKLSAKLIHAAHKGKLKEVQRLLAGDARARASDTPHLLQNCKATDLLDVFAFDKEGPCSM